MEALRSSPLAGALWETLACAEIRRSQSNRRGGWDLHFQRNRSREADFLLHRAGAFHLADERWTGPPRVCDAGALLKIAQDLPAGSVHTMSIFCRAPNPCPPVASTPFRSMRREHSRSGPDEQTSLRNGC